MAQCAAHGCGIANQTGRTPGWQGPSCGRIRAVHGPGRLSEIHAAHVPPRVRACGSDSDHCRRTHHCADSRRATRGAESVANGGEHARARAASRDRNPRVRGATFAGPLASRSRCSSRRRGRGRAVHPRRALSRRRLHSRASPRRRLGARLVVGDRQPRSGSGVYDRTFTDPATFDSLLAAITRETSTALGTRGHVRATSRSSGSAQATARFARSCATRDTSPRSTRCCCSTACTRATSPKAR